MLSYVSTRGQSEAVSPSEAIVKGIAKDGGLFVPTKIPTIQIPLEQLIDLSYQDLAFNILKLYLTDFTNEELKQCISNAYNERFDTPVIAPLASIDGKYFLELFHGPTLAFKDMALSILPYLLKTAAKKNGIDKKIVILTATSGDTGKAALEGFSDVEGTEIIVFFPENGVSPIQKAQMVTSEGQNTHVIGVTGNFDDTQTQVKKIFTDTALTEELSQKGYIFSSANSINIGRLVPQIVYYFYAYAQMCRLGAIKSGEKLNFTVPTGNFGNILAGYYAYHMGLPVGKLICASNENKVLYDFFKTGRYNRNREFILTSSPSMDILISSNLERLLYHVSLSNTGDLMNKLSQQGDFNFNTEEILKHFHGEYASEAETSQAIKDMFKCGYTMDTHTAVAYSAYEKYRKETGDERKNVVISTASPFKFTESVCSSIGSSFSGQDPFKLVDVLAKMGSLSVPKQLEGLATKPRRHNTVCSQEQMKDEVLKILNK